jgi:hypothetical protein
MTIAPNDFVQLHLSIGGSWARNSPTQWLRFRLSELLRPIGPVVARLDDLGASANLHGPIVMR